MRRRDGKKEIKNKIKRYKKIISGRIWTKGVSAKLEE
jgi:hypothetical protein